MATNSVPGASPTVAPKRALFSVSDKTGLRELAQDLHAAGCEIYATSSTRAALVEWGIPAASVESATGFPEILGGRVKTLHPKVFGGILARAGVPQDDQDLRTHGLAPFDVVVCTLYPFQDTLATLGLIEGASGKATEEIVGTLVEKIDIGGVTLLRAAAKNFSRVSVLCDPADYAAVRSQVAHGGIDGATRARLAIKALRETSAYDAVISSTLDALLPESDAAPTGVGAEGPVRAGGLFRPSEPNGGRLPETLHLEYRKVQSLRYGENPHQNAAFYAAPGAGVTGDVGGSKLSLPALRCFHGKELSYNNVLDVEHAVRLVGEFAEVASVIVKHNVACGVGLSASSPAEAYTRAFEGDPVSPFGGIVAFNRAVDVEAARALHETFLEVVVAPSFTQDASEILQRKKNLRLVELDTRKPLANAWQLSHVQGGLLVQAADASLWAPEEFKVVTKAAFPTESEATLRFAYAVVKHTRSNAIVLARAGQTIAVAGGFTNRVDAVRSCLAKARLPLEGAVLASDAFFPFPDSIELLEGTGVRAIVQPGGSVQDKAVIEACDARGIAMAFTGQRHFKH